MGPGGRRRGRVAFAALLLAGAALTGCTDDPEPSPAPAPAPDPTVLPDEPEPPTDPEPTAEPAPAGCPDTHPQPFTLEPIAPEFANVVAQLFACTDADSSSLYVDNRSLVVWQLMQPEYPATTEATGEDVTLDTFRFVMSQRPPTLLLLEPNRALTIPLAKGFRLMPDDAATAVWLTVMATETVVENYALGPVADELGADAPGRKAAADCGLAAFDAIKTLPDLEQKRQQAASLYVQDMLGLTTGAGECADSVRTWQQARQPAATAFTDDLARALTVTQEASAFDDVFRYVRLANPLS